MPASVYTAEVAAKLVALVESGTPITTACKIAGIARPTFYLWRKTNPEFDELIEQAEGKRESAALDRIKAKGEKDWKSDAWLLERTAKGFREVKETRLAVQKGVEEVLDAIRPHMSADAYSEMINAIATVSGLDSDESETA